MGLQCTQLTAQRSKIAASATAMSCSTVPALAPTAPTIQRDWYAASEDDDLAGIGFLNAVKRTARLRQLSQIRGCFVEDARCHRFVVSSAL
jgi:hypothetical protein